MNTIKKSLLLYNLSFRREAALIMQHADDMKLTGKEYVWVVSQSVVGDASDAPKFPVGLLGEWSSNC